MGRKFGTYGTFLDEPNGVRYNWVPGMDEDELPPDIVKRITNPKVWHMAEDIGVSNVKFDTGQEPAKYEDMTVPALGQVMRNRGLEAGSMKKAEIIAVLREQDMKIAIT